MNKKFLAVAVGVIAAFSVLLVGCDNSPSEEVKGRIELSVRDGADISAYAYEIIKIDNGSVISLDTDVAIVENNLVRVIGSRDGKLMIYDDTTKTAEIRKLKINQGLPFGLNVNTYSGAAITDFSNNVFAFTATADEDAIVKIDGNNIVAGDGIYAYGAHRVSVEKNNESHSFEINIAQPTEGNVYEIYATYATLPTLYSGLNMVVEDNEKFIWYGRSGTLSTAILEQDDKVTLSEFMYQTNNLATKVVEEIKDYVFSVMQKDPNAHFELYVDDFRHWIEITTLCELGLNADRYDVYYCSDGTYTYTKQYSYRNGPISTYNSKVTARASMVENARSNKYAADITDGYMNNGNTSSMDFCDDYIIPGAALDNIHYWAQYPEYVSSASKEVQAIFYNVIDKQLPELMYAALNNEQKNAFLALVNFDKATFDQTYFNKNNGKSYLIVTGTNPYSDDTYRYIQKVNTQYGEQYNIVFKPHPSAIPSGAAATNLADQGIEILPGRLPMEVILWIYPEYKTGGYNSSLYMSAPKGNTLFFFANDKQQLSSPIKELFDSLFYTAEFIALSISA